MPKFRSGTRPQQAVVRVASSGQFAESRIQFAKVSPRLCVHRGWRHPHSWKQRQFASPRPRHLPALSLSMRNALGTITEQTFERRRSTPRAHVPSAPVESNSRRKSIRRLPHAPRYFPSAFAFATPSLWRSSIISRSNWQRYLRDGPGAFQWGMCLSRFIARMLS